MKKRDKILTYLPLILVMFLMFANSCKKDETPVLLATLTTSTVIDITTTTAIGGGMVTLDGGANVSERGICWGTNTNPTIANYKTIDGTGTGSFTSTLTGLTENTNYYVRAYALNSAGIAYGNEQSFTTQAIGSPTLTTAAVTDILSSTATSGGNVTNDGAGIITERGICFSTTQNPSIASTKIVATGTTGLFVSEIIGLTGNTNYYIKAYATNSAGTSYGNELSFKTFDKATITTAEATLVTQTTATCGGEVTNDGGLAISEIGICYSTVQNPTTASTKIVASGITGVFTGNLINLTNNVIYYVRAYATNSGGTAYGNEISFIAGTVKKDIEGNLYHTINIGTQVWMVENLKTTKYNDGTDITPVTDGTAWIALTTPSYCWYNNDAATNKTTYGALYNWYAIDAASNGNKNICPVGWHVPNTAEWVTLRNYMTDNGYNYDGTTTGNKFAKIT